MSLPVIAGMGQARPGLIGQDEAWQRFFGRHFGEDSRARRVWLHSGVHQRGAAVVPWVDDVSRWGTEARMGRFLDEALPLAEGSLRAALDDAGVAPADVEQLTVVTCTGYATPGLDILLAQRLGMSEGLQRLHVGHMGCYAALPGLAAVADAAAARGRVGALVCVEVPSVHLQAATGQLDQVVAHALFSDAAAAVVVTPGGAGLEVVDTAARTDVGSSGHMRWDVTDHGFRMTLSPEVPAVLARHVGGAVEDLLGRHGLGPGDVAAWAVHPGGPRIVDVVADRLGLGDRVAASRQVLRDSGNSSSATVLLVLDALRRAGSLPPAGGYVVAMAFGPGLTLYLTLLRVRG